MVLEAMFEESSIKRHPLFVFFMAIALSSVGIWLAFLMFPKSASVLSIAFVSIGFMPVLHQLFCDEEQCEVEECETEKKPWWAIGFLARHFEIVKILAWMTIGLIVSYSFWYVFLPTEIRASVFAEQDSTTSQISQLKAEATGKVTQSNTMVCGKNVNCWFQLILENNAKVLGLEIIFSFIYGVGALFLIAWNASVIATVIGKDVLGLIGAATQSMGNIGVLFAYFGGLVKALGFLPHGLPELMAYFVGGIAGAIISAAISRKKYKTNEFWIIAKDAIVLIILAFLLLVIGSAIESQLISGNI